MKIPKIATTIEKNIFKPQWHILIDTNDMDPFRGSERGFVIILPDFSPENMLNMGILS